MHAPQIITIIFLAAYLFISSTQTTFKAIEDDKHSSQLRILAATVILSLRMIGVVSFAALLWRGGFFGR